MTFDVRKLSFLSVLVSAVLAVAPVWADQDGVGLEKISLPSGPGSIEGLGGAFEPQLNTGTASYGFPIAVTPGRGGMQPSLGISYNGGQGNSSFGIGWGMGTAAITRQTEKGLPRYGLDDRFTLGGEELVPLSDGSYRSENESSFTKAKPSEDGNGWVVYTANGTKSYLGISPQSRIMNPDMQDTFSGTFKWRVEKVVDVHGNTMTYDYTTFPDSPGQSYLREIRYSITGDEHTPSAYHYVRFNHEERSDVTSSYIAGFERTLGRRCWQIVAGSYYDSTEHLVRRYILDYTLSDLDPIEYYENSTNDADLSISLLRQVTQYDNGEFNLTAHTAWIESGIPNASSGNFLPPVRFGYSRLSADQVQRGRLENLPLIGWDNRNLALADMNADALPDLFYTDPYLGTHTVYYNEGEGRFASGVDYASPSGLTLENDSVVTLADYDGDARIDLVHKSGWNFFQYYPNTTAPLNNNDADPSWGQPVDFDPAYSYPSFSLNDPNVRSLDLDNDKRMDFVRTVYGMGTVHYLNKGTYWLTSDFNYFGVSGDDISYADGIDFSDTTHIRLADMNGDRLLDLVRVFDFNHRIEITWWPNKGFGKWGLRQIISPEASTIDLGLRPLEDLHFMDVNGDGLADTVLVDYDNVQYWINQGNGQFSDAFYIANTPEYIRDQSVLKFADINGNGSTDIIWSNWDGTQGGFNAQYVDFIAGAVESAPAVPNHLAYVLKDFSPYTTKPNLLRLIDNGIGLITEIDYRTSTSYYIAARAGDNPWATRLPFASWCVSGMTQHTGLDLDQFPGPDTYVTEFSYHDGYYDPIEKEFRGFAFARKVSRGDDRIEFNADPEDIHAPSSISRMAFHTGVPDGLDNDGDGFTDEHDEFSGYEEEALKGRVLWSETTVLTAEFDQIDNDGDGYIDESDEGPGSGQLADDAVTFSRSSTTWALRTLHTATSGFSEDSAAGSVSMNWHTMDQRKITLAYPYEAYATSIEAVGTLHAGNPWAAGATPITTKITTITNHFGQNTKVTEHGIVAGAATAFSTGNPLVYDDTRITETDYLYDTENWILGLPAQARLLDSQGHVHSSSQTFYDNLEFGQLGGKGLPTSTTAFVGSSGSGFEEFTALPGDPRVSDEAVVTSRIEYGAYGNPVKVMAPLYTDDDSGHARSMTYDPVFQQYIKTETVLTDSESPNLTASATYDYAAGAVLSSTDFNGKDTLYDHDSFYRLVASVRPGDTVEVPSAQYAYTPADPIRKLSYLYTTDGALTLSGNNDLYGLSKVATSLREEHGGETFDAFAFTDGAGKSLGTITEGDLDNPYVFSDLVDYTSNGQVRQAYLPFFGGADTYTRPTASTEFISNYYDASGRAIRTITPPESAEATEGSTTAVLHLPGKIITFDEEDTHVGGDHYDTPSISYSDGLGRGIFSEGATYTSADGSDETGALRYLSSAIQFNLSGAPVRFTDPQGNVKWSRYDQLGRLIFMQDPNRGSLEFTHDAAGNLKERRDSKEQLITYHYDSINRLTVEDYDNDLNTLTKSVEYVYDVATTVDQGDGSSDSNQNILGRLSYVRDLTGGHYFSYDERGRNEWSVKSIIDPTTGVETAYRTGLNYDAMDRVRSHTFPDGDQVDYAYNTRSLLQSISAEDVDIIKQINYRPEGNLSECTFGNDVVTSYQYDPRQRLSQLTTVSQGESLLDYSYDRDAANNITGMTDLRDLSNAEQATLRHNTRTGTYDDLYRLRELQINSLNTLTFQFDDLNNLVSKTALSGHQDGRDLEVANIGSLSYGGTSGSSGRGADNAGKGIQPGPHAITLAGADRSFTYDANGNMLTGDGLTLSWNVLDRLLSATSASDYSQYGYDYSGRRITKRIFDEEPSDSSVQPQSTTIYVNGTYEIRDGQPIKYVDYNGNRVARITRRLNPDNDFVQRIPLQPGWNVVALAVEGAELSLPDGIDSIHSFDLATTAITELSDSGSGYDIPAGSLIWVEASQHLVWSIKGAPINGPNAPQVFEPGSHWLPNFGTAAVALDELPVDATLWAYDTDAQQWSHRLTGRLANSTDSQDLLQTLNNQLAPGQVTLALFDTSFTLEPADSDLEIRYYHTDHLGSSSVMTTASGELAYEHYYFPYGSTRYEYAPKGVTEPYGYIGKELDQSTSLHYVEARYMLSGLGVFISVDPLENGFSGPWTPYGYTSGSPWTMLDLLGLNEFDSARMTELRAQASDPNNTALTRLGAAFQALGVGINPFNGESNLRAGMVQFNQNADVARAQLKDAPPIIREWSQFTMGVGMSGTALFSVPAGVGELTEVIDDRGFVQTGQDVATGFINHARSNPAEFLGEAFGGGSWLKTFKLKAPKTVSKGMVLSGHGVLDQSGGFSPMMIVPDGTSISFFGEKGTGLLDSIGQYIDVGFEIPYSSSNKITGAKTFLPGAVIPDYTLVPPVWPKYQSITVLGNPTTVTSPTRLSGLLRSNQGNVKWSACQKFCPEGVD